MTSKYIRLKALLRRRFLSGRVSDSKIGGSNKIPKVEYRVNPYPGYTGKIREDDDDDVVFMFA